MAKPKITSKQVMDYIRENKKDGRINELDVRNALKALGGTINSMSGVSIASLMDRIEGKPFMQKPNTFKRPTPGPIGPRSKKDTFNDKPPAEKANSGAKQLKRGGPVRKSKKSGRLAMRGYGKARK